MMRRLSRSPAMAVALVAFFVATSGGAFAAGRALIPGSRIKPHSLPLSALTPAAIAALQGQQGPAGPQGAPGPPGPSGGIDPTKLSVVTGDPSEVQPGTIAGVMISCPAGSIAVGGGGNTGGGRLVSLLPVVNATSPSLPVGWAALADNDTALPVLAEATVICASQ